MKFWLIFTMLFSFFNTTLPLTNHNLYKIEIKVKPVPGTTDGVISLAVDSQNTVYAGTNAGNVYKKLANQDSFDSNLILKANNEISSLAVDSKNNIYAGTYSKTDKNGKVYKSNNGQPFTEVTGASGVFRSLVVDKKNNTLWAGTNAGVYKKLENQDSFNPTPIPGANDQIYSLAVDSQNTVYAGTKNSINNLDTGKVYKSSNGQPFTEVTGIGKIVRSLVVDSQNTVYAGTGNGGVYKKLANQDSFNPTPIPGASGIIRGLAIDSKDTVYAEATTKGVYKKLANQDSFNPTPIPGTKDRVISSAVDLQNNIYIGTGNDGVYKISFDNSKSYLGIVISLAAGIFVVVILLIILIIYKIKKKTKTIV